MRRFACALLLFGCSKTVMFTGEHTLRVTAVPPPETPVAVEPPRVELRDNRIVIHDKIQFEYDRATILPVSFGLLDQVATVIRQNPHIRKLQVEGHASAEGDRTHNQRLSEQRARSVRAYLIQHGIAADLLTSRGFGVDKPISDNASETGREQNRRVEFN